MEATYRLETNELTIEFVKLLKKLYSGKYISITVEDVKDDTGYLLSSNANREMLMKRLNDIREGKNLISVNPKDL